MTDVPVQMKYKPNGFDDRTRAIGLVGVLGALARDLRPGGGEA